MKKDPKCYNTNCFGRKVRVYINGGEYDGIFLKFAGLMTDTYSCVIENEEGDVNLEDVKNIKFMD